MLQIYVTLEVCALILNGTFLALVWAKSNVRISMKHFLTNLAIANIAINIVTLAFDVSTFLSIPARRGLCLAQLIISVTCVSSTLGTVACIGIERLVALHLPTKYRQLYNVRNTRIIVVSILLASAGVSLMVVPDFFASEPGDYCMPSDLYPKRYGNVFIGCTICVLFLTVVVVLILLIHSLMVYAKSKPPTLESQAVRRKAVIASRIAVGSAFFYSACGGVMVTFMFWVQFSHCDDSCLLTGDFPLAANTMLNIFTLFDPVVYFISSGHSPCTPSRCCNAKVHTYPEPPSAELRPGVGLSRPIGRRLEPRGPVSSGPCTLLSVNQTQLRV